MKCNTRVPRSPPRVHNDKKSNSFVLVTKLRLVA